MWSVMVSCTIHSVNMSHLWELSIRTFCVRSHVQDGEITTCHVSVSIALSNEHAASHGVEIQVHVHARLNFESQFCRCFSTIWPLLVSNEELLQEIFPLGIRNLPGFFVGIAAGRMAVFRSSLMACPKQGEQKRQHLVHGSTTRQERGWSDDELFFRKADLSQVRFFHHRAGKGWCFW